MGSYGVTSGVHALSNRKPFVRASSGIRRGLPKMHSATSKARTACRPFLGPYPGFIVAQTGPKTGVFLLARVKHRPTKNAHKPMVTAAAKLQDDVVLGSNGFKNGHAELGVCVPFPSNHVNKGDPRKRPIQLGRPLAQTTASMLGGRKPTIGQIHTLGGVY